ncbi:amidohydrolase family protein [Pendulispora brunnea]|uniref:Amidohydrolase family protein n=1 Tax=Pendulispora brunnea TaxID=2905690 RepID=A0ABZ2KB54_9BACT
MKSLLVSALILGLASTTCSGGESSARWPAKGGWALTNVTVLDATGATWNPGMAIIVSDDRIVEVIRKDALPPAPAGATIVDGGGRYVVPGLWDSHVHTVYEDIELSLDVAMGVTSVRDMWGTPKQHALRAEIDAGKRLGPRYVIGSAIIDGKPVIHPGSVAVSDEAEGRAAVRRAKEEGADFIKVYSALTKANYLAIADEASKLHIPIAGHIPVVMPAARASDAGLLTAEHLYGIPEATSNREAELLEKMGTALSDWTKLETPTPRDVATFASRQSQAALLGARSYDEAKATALFRRLKDNGTWQTPTLTVARAIGLLDGTVGDPDGLRYIPVNLRISWENFIATRASLDERQLADGRELYERRLQLTGALHRAGVGLLAGTDAGNPYCIAGYGLHDELELMVKSGLTPMAALQAATIHPAKAFGLSDSLGTIAKGKIADLVVLDEDPLENIRNTRTIEAVVVRGRLVSHGERQKILADAEAAANRTPVHNQTMPIHEDEQLGTDATR